MDNRAVDSILPFTCHRQQKPVSLLSLPTTAFFRSPAKQSSQEQCCCQAWPAQKAVCGCFPPWQVRTAVFVVTGRSSILRFMLLPPEAFTLPTAIEECLCRESQSQPVCGPFIGPLWVCRWSFLGPFTGLWKDLQRDPFKDRRGDLQRDIAETFKGLLRDLQRSLTGTFQGPSAWTSGTFQVLFEGPSHGLFKVLHRGFHRCFLKVLLMAFSRSFSWPFQGPSQRLSQVLFEGPFMGLSLVL